MPVAVAIDARPLADPLGEPFVYTLNLVHALAFLESELRLVLFVDREPEADRLPRSARVSVQVLRAPPALWKLSALAPAAARAGCRVIHTQGLLPTGTRLPCVTTVRDLGPLERPEDYCRNTVLAWRHLLPRQLARAAAVLVPDEVIAAAVRDRLGVPAARIQVTPYGVEPAFRPQCDGVQATVTGHLRLPPEYLLLRATDGRAEPLAAIAREALAAAGRDLPLVVEGAELPGARSIASLEARLGPAVLSAAPAVLLGGEGERAVLAMLEAMACGVPVVGPAAARLREAAGPVAALGDHAEQVAALVALLSDPRRQARQMRGGLARVKARTWPAMAQRTEAVYRSVLGGGSPLGVG